MNRLNGHHQPMMAAMPSFGPEVDHTLIKDPMERYLIHAPEKNTPERAAADAKVDVFIMTCVSKTKFDGWGRRRLYGLNQPMYAHPNYESRFHLLLDQMDFPKTYKE